jgi:hypothetical protein
MNPTRRQVLIVAAGIVLFYLILRYSLRIVVATLVLIGFILFCIWSAMH